ncbi:hypothetical protein RFI_23600 [Reticulomyxa filosa]|uniref:Uncharacterized protein n=1 Tax=Reticulomyxa filosa TaxID=46433 RepID=X6MJC9_RETFI|nr:hypothetical protein RFI_23600 [Reticulomyxa filosa]|eukprot:ETO13766.1 hypothetical protein RFI_23600 [Reticulomyxa filosa]
MDLKKGDNRVLRLSQLSRYQLCPIENEELTLTLYKYLTKHGFAVLLLQEGDGLVGLQNAMLRRALIRMALQRTETLTSLKELDDIIWKQFIHPIYSHVPNNEDASDAKIMNWSDSKHFNSNLTFPPVEYDEIQNWCLDLVKHVSNDGIIRRPFLSIAVKIQFLQFFFFAPNGLIIFFFLQKKIEFIINLLQNCLTWKKRKEDKINYDVRKKLVTKNSTQFFYEQLFLKEES